MFCLQAWGLKVTSSDKKPNDWQADTGITLTPGLIQFSIRSSARAFLFWPQTFERFAVCSVTIEFPRQYIVTGFVAVLGVSASSDHYVLVAIDFIRHWRRRCLCGEAH